MFGPRGIRTQALCIAFVMKIKEEFFHYYIGSLQWLIGKVPDQHPESEGSSHFLSLL